MPATFRMAAVAVIVVTLAPERLSAQPDEVIRTIQKAWEAREKQFDRIRANWKQTIVYKPGGVTQESVLRGKAKQLLPTSETTFDGHYKFAMEGQKMRCEVQRKVFHRNFEDWVDWNHTAVFDGQAGLSFEDQRALPIKTARREAGEIPSEFRTPSLFPILHHTRPMQTHINTIVLDRYGFSGRKQQVHGEECLELVLRKPPVGVRVSVWVSPRLGHCVLRRHAAEMDGARVQSSIQDDIHYREVTPGVWFPSSWTIQVHSGGNLLSRNQVDAVTVEIGKPIDSAAFSVDPPPKSLFEDMGKDRRTTETAIWADGTSTPVTRENYVETVRQPSLHRTGRTLARDCRRIRAAEGLPVRSTPHGIENASSDSFLSHRLSGPTSSVGRARASAARIHVIPRREWV